MLKLQFAAVATCTIVASCTTEGGSERFVQPSEGMQVFHDFCLSTLPDFSQFEQVGASQVAKPNGLVPHNFGGDIFSSFRAQDKNIGAILASKDGMTACSSTFDTTPGIDVGANILATALNGSDITKAEKFDSSFFEYAYQLPNGSVLTYDKREKHDRTRHIFFISQPIPRSEVGNYIYN